MDEDESNIPGPPTVGAEELVLRSQNLLGELEEFEEFLAGKNRRESELGNVELRQFRNSITAESKSLRKLTTADPTSEKTVHTLRSSNLPFYEAVWAAAKSSTGLVAFNKRFYWEEASSGSRAVNKKVSSGNTAKTKQKNVLVDIVTQGGLEWVKVSTITEARLLFDMAKAGWEQLSDSEDGEDEEDGDGAAPSATGSGDELSLVKLAEELSRAARATRIRYKHPQVRFVLPKIGLGTTPEIDTLIANIKATGAQVECGSSLSADGTHVPALKEVACNLLVDPFAGFSPTLNIDCTILLALVSDLSHGAVALQPRFHRAIVRQIELEKQEKLLPDLLFPAMGVRELVCTREAHRRMREIVELIGTTTERRRTVLLMGDDPSKPREVLVDEFRELSDYEVPRDWNLPIRVVESDIDAGKPLPATAKIIAEKLSEINRSVFLFGWASGLTTISSNRTVAKLIENLVEGHRKGDDETGPSIWLCPTARSLVGKEKNRKS
ncbi:hypothetical protein FGG08_000302 [Glutinoglossum americanum]|uniref:DUF1308 domain-containing protein n=1 Tax=Glutinoglossum americanum TaxID=1670608 RepID=A0A9P8L1H5_9PEZI|nr:hypothetical protein FGG08_000302 [Glutinoglossum americanum]